MVHVDSLRYYVKYALQSSVAVLTSGSGRGRAGQAAAAGGVAAPCPTSTPATPAFPATTRHCSSGRKIYGLFIVFPVSKSAYFE